MRVGRGCVRRAKLVRAGAATHDAILLMEVLQHLRESLEEFKVVQPGDGATAQRLADVRMVPPPPQQQSALRARRPSQVLAMPQMYDDVNLRVEDMVKTVEGIHAHLLTLARMADVRGLVARAAR